MDVFILYQNHSTFTEIREIHVQITLYVGIDPTEGSHYLFMDAVVICIANPGLCVIQRCKRLIAGLFSKQ